MVQAPVAVAAPPPLAPTPPLVPTGLAMPAIIVLAVGLRVALAWWWPQTPFSDGEWYLVRAREIAAGLGYQEAGHPTAFWPVGYPTLLAAFLRAFGANGAVVANLAATVATLLLIDWFARVCGPGANGNAAAGRVGALIYAVYPAAIVYAGAPLSEVTSTAVAMGAFALLIAGQGRPGLLLASGLAFGAATLMRAQMLLFPIGAIVAVMLADRHWGWRRALLAGVLVAGAMAAVIAPWTWRNHQQLGRAVLVSTNGGVALYTGANDQADGDYLDWEHGPLWAASGIPYADRVERQVELNDRFQALAKAWIAAHPARWTALGFRKTALLWRKDSDAFWSMQESYPNETRAWWLVALADQLWYFAMLALALPAFAIGLHGMARRDGTAPLALLGVMPAFVTLTAFCFTGQIRYHFPAMPFVAAAAGWTLVRLNTWRLSRRSGSGRPAA